MRTILVANRKGGCGKTMAAITARRGAGRRRARGWRSPTPTRRSRRCTGCSARPAGAAPIAGLDWTHKGDVGDAPKAIDWLVIDAPGALKGARAEALIAEADAVIAPVLPSSFDADSTRRFLRDIEEIKRIRKGKVGVHLVANRMRTGRAGERQRAFFDDARRRRRSPGSPSAASTPTWPRRASASSTGRSAATWRCRRNGSRCSTPSAEEERRMDLGIRGSAGDRLRRVEGARPRLRRGAGGRGGRSRASTPAAPRRWRRRRRRSATGTA